MFPQTTQATEFILDCLSTLLKISLNNSMSRQATIVQYFQKAQAYPFSLPLHICYLRLTLVTHTRHVTNIRTRALDSKHFVVMKVLFIRISMPEHICSFLATQLFTRRNLNQKFDPDFSILEGDIWPTVRWQIYRLPPRCGWGHRSSGTGNSSRNVRKQLST